MSTTDSTRDIAISADTKVDAHIEDCVAVRLRIEKKMDLMSDKMDKLTILIILVVLGAHILNDTTLKALGGLGLL